MSLELFIPELNKKPTNTKDAIISILKSEWPLTLKKIYNRIKKFHKLSCSYQAVYKSVNELIDKSVLRKKGNEYEINIDWIKRLQTFTDIVETNYYTEKKFKNILGVEKSSSSEDLLVLHFKTIFDAEKYLYYFIKNELIKKKNEKVIYQLMNEWRPLYYLRAEYNFFKKLAKKGHSFYFLISGDSYLENQAKKFYNQIGAKAINTKELLPNDTIIFSDFVIQIFIPEPFRKKMKKYLKEKNTIKLLEEVLEKGTDIRVIINKDSSLSKLLKNQALRKFK